MEKIAWAGIVRAHPLPERIRAVAEHRYDTISVSVADLDEAAAAGHSIAGLIDLATEAGIRVSHLDPLATWIEPWQPPDDGWSGYPMMLDFLGCSVDRFFGVADELGVDSITAIPSFAAGAHPRAYVVERFAALCDRAAASDIRVDLELIRGWGIPDLKTAWEIVEASGAANAAICLDFWHLLRGKADLGLLADIPGERIGSVQVCGALREPQSDSPIEDTLFHRVQPQDSEFDVASVLRTLAQTGGLRVVGPEVFSATQDAKPLEISLTETTDAFSAVLSEAGL